MSNENAPIPQARGGNVEKIAIRTMCAAPLSPDARGLHGCCKLDRLAASVTGYVNQFESKDQSGNCSSSVASESRHSSRPIPVNGRSSAGPFPLSSVE